MSFRTISSISTRALGASGHFGRDGACRRSAKSASSSQCGSTASRDSVVFSGGCFWGVQAVFQHIKGVISATSGYTGGAAATAEYEVVSTGSTGHAESVKVIWDPSQVTYAQLLKVFFSGWYTIPRSLNYQGPDHGTQYRSMVSFTSAELLLASQAYIDELSKAKVFSRPIVTQLVPLKAFYAAEGYHQDYATLHPDNPYIAINDLPKVENPRKQFPDLYTERKSAVVGSPSEHNTPYSLVILAFPRRQAAHAGS